MPHLRVPAISSSWSHNGHFNSYGCQLGLVGPCICPGLFLKPYGISPILFLMTFLQALEPGSSHFTLGPRSRLGLTMLL